MTVRVRTARELSPDYMEIRTGIHIYTCLCINAWSSSSLSISLSLDHHVLSLSLLLLYIHLYMFLLGLYNILLIIFPHYFIAYIYLISKPSYTRFTNYYIPTHILNLET